MGVRKKSLAQFMLIALEKSVDGYVRLEDMLYHPQRYISSDPSLLKKSNLSQAIKRLRERKVIEIENRTQGVVLKLSALGKELVIDSTNRQKKWDGKWRIVIFDIPEKNRAVRDVLRRRLRDWDFKPLQQSVWVSKHDVTTVVGKLIKSLGIEKWVLVIESSKILPSNQFFNGRGIND